MPTNAEIHGGGGGGSVTIPGGSDTQLQYNNAGAFAGLPSLTTDGTNLSLSGLFTLSKSGGTTNGAAIFTGLPPTGVSAKPTLLLEQTGTTAGTWSTNGTFLGINAPTAYAGSLQSWRVAGVEKASVDLNGFMLAAAGTRYSFNSTNYFAIGDPNQIRITLGGAFAWYMTSGAMGGVIGGAGALGNIASSATNPAFFIQGDNNSGIYGIGADNLGITCGGVKQVDISTSLVTFTNAIKTGAPSGAAGGWKLGLVTAGAVTLDTSNYVEISIGGVVKKLLIAS